VELDDELDDEYPLLDFEAARNFRKQVQLIPTIRSTIE